MDAGLKDPRILIVDDDESFADSAKVFLQSEGCFCGRAWDGESAWQTVRERPWDVLVAEIAIAGNRRLELVRRVGEAYPDLSVILATGHPSQETAIEAIRLPVVAYLIKPVKMSDLGEVVRTAVQKSFLLRTLRGSRERLSGWVADLGRLEEAIRASNLCSPAGGAQRHMDLMLSNFAANILDMKSLLDIIHGEGGVDPTFRASEQVEQLRAALAEAIETIGRTKGAFKSKQLGLLRKKLQEVAGKT